MHIASKNRNQSVKEILNGTFASLKIVVPLEHTISKPKILTNFVPLQFGVLIGITGDIRGKLVFSGEKTIIGSIGELMYGMPLEGDMLYSFGGELGNMIAGGLSTIIAESGFNTDITSPTILQGETQLSGFKNAIEVAVMFKSVGNLNIYLLLDQ